MFVCGWLNQQQFVMAWLFYVTLHYLEGHRDVETLTHKKAEEAINATIFVIGLWSLELGNNSLVLRLKGTWSRTYITANSQDSGGAGGAEMGRTGGIPQWDGVHASCCVCVCVCECLQKGYTGRLVCQLSITVLAVAFSSQAFSTHNLTKEPVSSDQGSK